MTSGTLALARTGGGGTRATNTWRAPSSAGVVYLWAVLRDSRGGLSRSSAATEVR